MSQEKALEVINEMATLVDYLKEIYFDPKHPAFFAGPRKLYSIVKKKGYSPTFSFIKQWTQDQDSYSLYKPSRNKFQRARVITKGIGHMFDADLLDLQDIAHANDGTRYLLVVIDNFSKKLAVRPLKNKTAAEVVKAFTDIFDHSLDPPELLRTDAGKEFLNRQLKAFLKDKNVRHQVARNEGKAHFSERVIKTIKKKIFHYLSFKNTQRYLDVLSDLVKGYNNSVHRTLGMSPNSVNKDNSSVLWWKMYRPKRRRRLPYAFRVGDTVRITHLKNKFTREYSQKWTGEIFTVRSRYRIDGVPVYQLKDFNNEDILGTFYKEELQKVEIEPDKLFQIDKVIRTRKVKGKKQYLVRWRHWGPAFDSWVDEVYNRQ
jgi:hypothetical protein